MKRPEGANADEWALFLSEHVDAIDYLAVQIAEAIECAETRERPMKIVPRREIFPGYSLIFVAAGYYSTARGEMREIGLAGKEWKYISRGEILYGMPPGSPILYLNDFFEHYHFEQIGLIAMAQRFRKISRGDLVRAVAAFKTYRDGDRASDFTTSNGVTVTIIVNPAHKPRIVNADGSIREVEPGWEGDMLRENTT